MRSFFFSPKGRITVSRRTATWMNALNMLAPVLLGCAMILALMVQFGAFSPPLRQFLLQYAAILVGLALLVRILWGVLIRNLQKRQKRSHQGNP